MTTKTDIQTSRNDFNIHNWQPITTFLELNPQFNIGQLRWLIRNRNHNGFSACIRRIGRYYYINDQLFAKWITNRE